MVVRAIRFVLRVATCLALAVGVTGGVTFVLAEHVVPLTWTTESAIEREVRRSTEAHARWGNADAPIEVSRARVPIAHHSPFGWEMAEGVERGDRGSLRATLHTIDLDAGACVDVRVALSGSDWLRIGHLDIEEDGVVVGETTRGASGRWHHYLSLLRGRPPEGSVLLGQWCSPAGGRVRLTGVFRPVGGPSPRWLESLGGDHVAHVVVGRTPPGALLEGFLSVASAAGRERWLAHEANVDERARITDPIESLWSRGVPLLPATPPVWTALVEASALETGRWGNPGVDADLRGGDGPFGRVEARYPRDPLPPRTPPVIVFGGDTWRVLAAVDLGDLGAPCVRVSLVRREISEQAPPVRALAIPSLTARPLEREGVVSSEVSCPARGLRLYLVTPRDRADYRVEILREPAPPEASAAPSDFSGGLRLAGEDACDAGDAGACESVALRLAYWPAFADRRERGRAMLATLCAAGRPRTCVAYALTADPPDLVALSARCREAREAEPDRACMRLGDAIRDRARGGDVAEMRRLAMDAYRLGCAQGDRDACFNQSARFP